MLHVNANKKRIQQHISQSTGKVVLLKDIHNIKTGKNHKKTTPDEELGKIKYWLSAQKELYHQYVTDENDHIQGIYMQDETMKTTFEKFPEVILLNATHKTNDLRMPLYLMLTVDSNGESEVVASFIATMFLI